MPRFSLLSGTVRPGVGEEMAALAGFYVVYFLLIFAISLISYIFTSLGCHTIAKRRGIGKAWLAWIPVGELWILGSISDRYQLQAHYRTKNKRKALLILQVILIVLLVLLMIFVGTTVLSLIKVMQNENPYYPFVDYLKPVRDNLKDLIWLYFVLLGVAAAATVVQYMALYDLYRSCDPGSSVLFLVLSILLPIVTPFLVFSVRRKDLGMQPMHSAWEKNKE